MASEQDQRQDCVELDTDTQVDQQLVREYLGEAYAGVEKFASLLRTHGEERGILGPREAGRLWRRHLLNSAAVVPYLPKTGRVVDVGSGAGLPGIVIATIRPDVNMVLVEPMDRRCGWLEEVAAELRLDNVEVKRGRAEEFDGALEADAVTARAVAPLSKLTRWCFPLLRVGGALVALKGRRAAEEIFSARRTLKKFAASEPEIIEASTIVGVEPTFVVRSRRGR